jgi:hypothetical protein
MLRRPSTPGIGTAYVHVGDGVVYIVTGSVADVVGNTCFVRGAVIPTTVSP